MRFSQAIGPRVYFNHVNCALDDREQVACCRMHRNASLIGIIDYTYARCLEIVETFGFRYFQGKFLFKKFNKKLFFIYN